jgi:hypothetical protein
MTDTKKAECLNEIPTHECGGDTITPEGWERNAVEYKRDVQEMVMRQIVSLEQEMFKSKRVGESNRLIGGKTALKVLFNITDAMIEDYKRKHR